MNKQQTVSVGEANYDAHTGKRLDGLKTGRSTATAHNVHKKPSKSHTLSRRYVKVPAGHHKVRTATAKPTIKTSPMVSKFADVRPVAKPASTLHKKQMSDITPIKHPIQHKVAARVSAQPVSPKLATPSALDLKHQAITNALHRSGPAPRERKQSFARRHPRLVSAGTASFAIVLLAGYFTYINLPSISVRVAAAQAGIDAAYPSYQPAGYGIRGPVAYENGEVSINFKSTTNPSHFTVNQSKSGWDSSALLDNYIIPQSNNNYASYNDNGLTIYVYGSSAAWVNGGILHTIEGDAELSGDQIRRIATSM